VSTAPIWLCRASDGPARGSGYSCRRMLTSVPVLLITFNRPDLASATARAIADLNPSAVYLASDGPRTPQEAPVVNETRNSVLDALADCAPIFTLFRDQNLGCKCGVESAVTWFFDNVGEGIILEDDCVPSRSFFDFCGLMLGRYRHDERVMHISGYYAGMSNPGSYVYSKLPRVWGWASWRRAWEMHDCNKPISPWNEIDGAFGSREQSRYFRSKVEAVANGTLDTWDFGWTASVVANSGLAVQPLANLVTNTGVGDARAAHTTRDRPEVGANHSVSYGGAWQGPPRVLPDFAYDRRTFRSEIASPAARLKSAVPPIVSSIPKRVITWVHGVGPS
jgi:hypothetical protein